MSSIPVKSQTSIAGPVRFADDVPVSFLWKIAENLIDFGGKGHKVVALNNLTQRVLVAEDRGQKLSLGLIVKSALKVVALAALYLSGVGGIAHYSILSHNRKHSQLHFIKVPNELRDNYFFPYAMKTLTQISQEKPENYGDNLTDRKINKDDVNFMKSLKLKDMTFTNVENGQKFLIKNINSEESMEFSNRNSSKGELRGIVLRSILEKFKEQDSHLSLYNAISRIIISKDSDVYQATLSAFASINEGNSDLLKTYADEFLSPRE